MTVAERTDTDIEYRWPRPLRVRRHLRCLVTLSTTEQCLVCDAPIEAGSAGELVESWRRLHWAHPGCVPLAWSCPVCGAAPGESCVVATSPLTIGQVVEDHRARWTMEEPDPDVVRAARRYVKHAIALRDEAMAEPCPRCGEGDGRPCRTATGNETNLHAARRDYVLAVVAAAELGVS
jgi:hypothetical protein